MPTAFARTDNLKCHARYTKHYEYAIVCQQHVATHGRSGFFALIPGGGKDWVS